MKTVFQFIVFAVLMLTLGCSKPTTATDEEMIVGEIVKFYMKTPHKNARIFLDASDAGAGYLEHSAQIWPGLRPAHEAQIETGTLAVISNDNLPGVLFKILQIDIGEGRASVKNIVRQDGKSGETCRFKLLKNGPRWEITDREIISQN